MDPADDLDQGGFSGAVFPDQGMNLPGANIKIDIFKHRNTAEGFGDFFCADYWRRHTKAPIFPLNQELNEIQTAY
jgi:hypothetical protein